MPNGIVNGTIHFLDQCNQHEVQHDFFGQVVPLVLEQHEMMLITSSVTPLHFFGQDAQNEYK